MVRAIFLGILMLGAAGCASSMVEEPPWPTPTPVAQAPEVPKARGQSTSLWSEGAILGGVYDDHRARHIGDLVTVVVVESSAASREATTDVKRDASVSAGVGGFLGMPTNLGLKHLYGSTGFDPSVNANTANSFKGAGSTTRKDQLQARVSARVVNMLDDGNLVIEGRRQVKVNEETQYLFVRGIARPIDILPDNTITSASLADGQIIYSGNGIMASQQKPGWLYRVLDAVWPF